MFLTLKDFAFKKLASDLHKAVAELTGVLLCGAETCQCAHTITTAHGLASALGLAWVEHLPGYKTF